MSLGLCLSVHILCLCVPLYFSFSVYHDCAPFLYSHKILIYNAMRPGRSKEKQLKQVASSLLLTNVVLHEDKSFFVLLILLGAREKGGIREQKSSDNMGTWDSSLLAVKQYASV